jgi:GDP-4-dehydro-6-deoxy-D-mannose reductase
MRFLVTGVGGFVGPHLVRLLLERGHEVVGLTRRPGTRAALDELHRRYGGRFEPRALIPADVLDPRAVRNAIAAVRPDGLFHLAAISFVPASDADPLAAYRTNFLGTLNVLRAVAEVHRDCRVLFVGSGDAYGASGIETAELTEEALLRPVSAYGVSKAAADLAAFQWHWTQAGQIVRARPFNHVGAGQSALFVCSDFARQVAEIEVGQRPAVLEVGNLDAVRDFSHVEDIVAGYLALWERGRGGEVYNLCSGRGLRIRDIVDEVAGRSRVRFEVRTLEGRRRPYDIPRLVGSFAKAEAATGWRPVIPVARAFDEVLDFWRHRVAAP